MSEYDSIRHQLLDMLEELDHRLDRITDDVKHIDHPPEQDFSEQATEAENNEVIDAIGNTTRTDIEKIKQALLQIEKGTYGFCVTCGEPIKKERLSALPFAIQCVPCASKTEKHLH